MGTSLLSTAPRSPISTGAYNKPKKAKKSPLIAVLWIGAIFPHLIAGPWFARLPARPKMQGQLQGYWEAVPRVGTKNSMLMWDQSSIRVRVKSIPHISETKAVPWNKSEFQGTHSVVFLCHTDCPAAFINAPFRYLESFKVVPCLTMHLRSD